MPVTSTTTAVPTQPTTSPIARSDAPQAPKKLRAERPLTIAVSAGFPALYGLSLGTEIQTPKWFITPEASVNVGPLLTKADVGVRFGRDFEGLRGRSVSPNAKLSVGKVGTLLAGAEVDLVAATATVGVMFGGAKIDRDFWQPALRPVVQADIGFLSANDPEFKVLPAFRLSVGLQRTSR